MCEIEFRFVSVEVEPDWVAEQFSHFERHHDFYCISSELRKKVSFCSRQKLSPLVFVSIDMFFKFTPATDILCGSDSNVSFPAVFA